MDKTLGLLVDCAYSPKRARYRSIDDPIVFLKSVYFGIVVRPHKLFRIGDVVGVVFSNGGGSRWPVYAVSSKGFRILGHYLGFQHTIDQRAWHVPHWQSAQRGKLPCFANETEAVDDAILVEESSDQPNTALDLYDSWSVDPTVQRHVVGSLRARIVDKAVGAGIRLSFPEL